MTYRKDRGCGRMSEVETHRLGIKLMNALLLALSIGILTPPRAHANDLGKGIPSEAALRAKMALKLAGLVTFVANSCPDLKPDYVRFKTAIQTLGVSYDDLSKQDMKAEYLGYAALYRVKVQENCARASSEFGPAGKTVANIFVDAKPH